jgi:hypothetical protein
MGTEKATMRVDMLLVIMAEDCFMKLGTLSGAIIMEDITVTIMKKDIMDGVITEGIMTKAFSGTRERPLCNPGRQLCREQGSSASWCSLQRSRDQERW